MRADAGANEFILTLSCRDTKGIVYAVSGLLFQAGCNIIDSQQFGDLQDADATGRCSSCACTSRRRRSWPTPPRWTALFATRARAVRHGRCSFHALGAPAARAADGEPARPLPERPAVPLAAAASSTSTSRRSSRTTPTFAELARELRHRRSTTCRWPPGADAEAKRAQEQRGRGAGRARAHRPRRARALHADPVARVLRCAGGPRDQHPPQLPAQLQGRASRTTRRTTAA